MDSQGASTDFHGLSSDDLPHASSDRDQDPDVPIPSSEHGDGAGEYVPGGRHGPSPENPIPSSEPAAGDDEEEDTILAAHTSRNSGRNARLIANATDKNASFGVPRLIRTDKWATLDASLLGTQYRHVQRNLNANAALRCRPCCYVQQHERFGGQA